MALDYNIILDTDSYKLSHFLFYAPGSERIFSYAESRGGRYPATLFFGLQGFAKQLAETRVTKANIEEGRDFAVDHGVPFNEIGWRIIEQEYNGFLPVRIRAIPEGTVVPTRNVLCTVENLDDRLPWLTSYLETPLLRDVWTGTTVATRVFFMKQAIREAFVMSSDNPEANMAFSLLDFSSRGTTSYQSNQKTGAAFLANMVGTDSIPAVRYVNDVYNSKMSGFSVPATEHSIMESWTQQNEMQSLLAMILAIGNRGGGILSIVGDTWNIYQVARYLVQLKDIITQNKVNIVLRPDSGDFKIVLEQLFAILGEGFGYTMNSKDYKVLNGIKILWGDGVNEKTAPDLFRWLVGQGWAADNLMLGSGGGLVQADIDRDTCKFAFKAAAVKINGQWNGIAKDPITDPGKRSKAGAMNIYGDDGFQTEYTGLGPIDTDRFDRLNNDPNGLLEDVYTTGKLIRSQSIEDVRARANASLGVYDFRA